jgi:hypothetical protein
MDELTDEERQALIAAARKALADDPFPRSPRLEPLRSALAKLDPSSVPRPIPPFKPLLRLPRAAAAGGRLGDRTGLWNGRPSIAVGGGERCLLPHRAALLHRRRTRRSPKRRVFETDWFQHAAATTPLALVSV